MSSEQWMPELLGRLNRSSLQLKFEIVEKQQTVHKFIARSDRPEQLRRGESVQDNVAHVIRKFEFTAYKTGNRAQHPSRLYRRDVPKHWEHATVLHFAVEHVDRVVVKLAVRSHVKLHVYKIYLNCSIAASDAFAHLLLEALLCS